MTARCSGGVGSAVWEEFEVRGVCRANDVEVAMVERRDSGGNQMLGQDDDAGIGVAQVEVVVGVDEFCDPNPIGAFERLHQQIAIDDRLVEQSLGRRAAAPGDQVRGFGNDHGRCEERTRFGFE